MSAYHLLLGLRIMGAFKENERIASRSVAKAFDRVSRTEHALKCSAPSNAIPIMG